MGTCCSKRQDQELALTYTSGFKKTDVSFNSSLAGQKQNNGSIDSHSRYTPDPNRVQLKQLGGKGGVDIIRPTRCKYNLF